MASIEQFKRKYTLKIGIPGTNGREYSDLQVKFNIDKTNEKDPNKCNIEITNLNSDSRNFFNKKGNFFILDGGYEVQTGLLFKGSIEKCSSVQNGNDWITTIESKDGIKEFRSKIISKSFNSGVKLSTLLNDCVNSFGLTVGNIKDIPDITFNTGRVLYGNVSDNLTELCKPFGLKWFIQNEVVYISGINKPTGNEIILIDASSGMIGSPEKLESQEKKTNGWKFKILLNAGVNVGNLIKVDSKIVKGIFLVKKINHSGDFTGQDWYTIIEAQEKK